MLKAIETEHAGYLFHSRLEARWAVFFDRAGISYRYEPEGYELPNGERYLPDFFLPTLDAWVEIKPNEQRLLAAKNRLEEFAGGIWPTRFYVLIDDPYVVGYGVWRPNVNGMLKSSEQRWTECLTCDAIDLLPPNQPPGTVRCGDCGESENLERRSPRLVAAYTTARQERFGT